MALTTDTKKDQKYMGEIKSTCPIRVDKSRGKGKFHLEKPRMDAECDMESMEAQFEPLLGALKAIATHRLKTPNGLLGNKKQTKE